MATDTSNGREGFCTNILSQIQSPLRLSVVVPDRRGREVEYCVLFGNRFLAIFAILCIISRGATRISFACHEGKRTFMCGKARSCAEKRVGFWLLSIGSDSCIAASFAKLHGSNMLV